jgi:hypothetical protein
MRAQWESEELEGVDDERRQTFEEVAEQGEKAMLATAPDADILREIVCLLTNACDQGELLFRQRRSRIVENRSTSELTPYRRRDGKFPMTTKVG